MPFLYSLDGIFRYFRTRSGQFSAVLGSLLAFFGSFRHFSAFFGSFRHFSAVFRSFRQFSLFPDQVPAVFGSFWQMGIKQKVSIHVGGPIGADETPRYKPQKRNAVRHRKKRAYLTFYPTQTVQPATAGGAQRGGEDAAEGEGGGHGQERPTEKPKNSRRDCPTADRPPPTEAHHPKAEL